MKLRAVLFDLDGTLLPMDQDVFLGDYFRRLAAHIAPYGYDPKQLYKAIWSATGAMIRNDGAKTNEQRFWDAFSAIYPDRDMKADYPRFDEFYRVGFPAVQSVVGFSPRSAEVVAHCKKAGLTVALATNPVFPAIATEHRIAWAGLNPSDFAHYTTYENTHHAKPNPDYYREVAQILGVDPEECLMVGNDVTDDMIASTVGMRVFLLTDCLINKEGAALDAYPHGDFDALIAHIDTLR